MNKKNTPIATILKESSECAVALWDACCEAEAEDFPVSEMSVTIRQCYDLSDHPNFLNLLPVFFQALGVEPPQSVIKYSSRIGCADAMLFEFMVSVLFECEYMVWMADDEEDCEEWVF